jgi:hypothetical protein
MRRVRDPSPEVDIKTTLISWISCSDFPPSQIGKEFLGRIKGGPKDIGTAKFETLSICEKSMNYWDGGLSIWRQLPEHAANGSLNR